MPIAPGSIVPADTLVTPIVQQLVVVSQQIAGIGTCYTDPPDRAPADNSVIFPLRDWKVLDDTNAKVKVELVFEVLHLFTRTNLARAVARAYTFLPAWFNVLTADSNQSLGGHAILMNLVGQPGTIKGFTYTNTPYLAISHQVAVLTEFNINLS